eukprot:NODE_123_length_18841_cov_0.279693.p9 type:complete len:154 gc:universal NODE_123_length_18841_cov_0.279693:18320-18781(+)
MVLSLEDHLISKIEPPQFFGIDDHQVWKRKAKFHRSDSKIFASKDLISEALKYSAVDEVIVDAVIAKYSDCDVIDVAIFGTHSIEDSSHKLSEVSDDTLINKQILAKFAAVRNKSRHQNKMISSLRVKIKQTRRLKSCEEDWQFRRAFKRYYR